MNISAILPRSKKYPTSQSNRIRSFAAELERRTRAAYRKAAEYAAGLTPSGQPVIAVNYSYALDPMKVSQTQAYVTALLNQYIYGNPDGLWSEGWWANVYASGAYGQGTSQVIRQAQILVSDAKVIDEVPQMRYITAESVLMEPGYQRRLSLVYGRVYESMQGFTDDQRKIMSGTITKGMAAGKSPRVIAKELSEKTGQIRWRALRIAATEINTAFNRATLEETTALNDDVFADSAYEMAVMHISSLLVTTRPDHGRRHGTIATPEEQNYWWDNVAVGGRINCHCSTVDVLVNKKTREPMQSRLVAKVLEQRKQYFWGD